jgi:hypothetical protein
MSFGVAAIIGMAALPAWGEWSAAYKADFLRQCESGCERNTQVPPDQKLRCRAFCNCFVAEGEVVAGDSAALERELGAGKDTETVRRFKAIGPVCNQRVFE